MEKLPEIITEEELLAIINIARSKQIAFSYALGFYECMRVSEIIKLTIENINHNLKLLYIKQAKGHKDRNIPIAPEVLKGLKYLPIKCSIRTLERNFKADCKKAAGKDLHFHSLRHSGITHYLTKKKWSSLEVQRLAGHSKIATTQIYTHINPQDLVNRMWE
jgi:integrase